MIGRPLDQKVFVAPQITTDDLEQLHSEGFSALICNRPDAEVSPDLSSDAIKAAAASKGFTFANVPLSSGGLTIELISAHLKAIDATDGKVLSYCASGTRSAYLWAFAMALADRLSDEEILGAMEQAGYPSPGLGPQLDQVRSLSA